MCLFAGWCRHIPTARRAYSGSQTSASLRLDCQDGRGDHAARCRHSPPACSARRHERLEARRRGLRQWRVLPASPRRLRKEGCTWRIDPCLRTATLISPVPSFASAQVLVCDAGGSRTFVGRGRAGSCVRLMRHQAWGRFRLSNFSDTTFILRTSWMGS